VEKTIVYKSVEELPATLNVEDVAKALNISRANAYVLVNSESFPKIKLGKRLLVPKQAFVNWMDSQLTVKAGV
jgi:Predicted transcriptional regulator